MSDRDIPRNTVDTILTQVASRRTFLRNTAFTAVAAGALSACKTEKQGAGGAAAGTSAETTQTAEAKSSAAGKDRPGTDSDQSGGTTGAHPEVTPAMKARQAADDMDRMHEAGVKAFPAKTEGKGNQPLAPKIVGGVKVFELTAKELQWETKPGKKVLAWAYNGQVPGPQIRVREGDRVRLVLKNELPESTAVHFHGVELPNDQDGVPFITQPPVKPGESYTYEFTAPNPGSHMYHSHHNAAKQVGLGLLGAFIIEPKRKRAIENVDVDFVMILNDGMHGYTLNGKDFPATEPVVAKLGQKVRIRFMNEGMMIHPMHLHGMHMTVIDKDGWPQPAPWKCDTLNVAPGERWDVVVNCNNPGVWAFHCHILPHAESDHGMFGMVTALIVNK
ncbi:MAG TPA: multicopper oxidase domain-containing protein [Gemmatimonadaceae bacterium]|nr:multicopper oxidase domain-containing protein [Gemmatimonadaceae bacterium]